MKPWDSLGQAVTPDGTVIKLSRRGDEYIILANGKSLMSSRMHGSEEALATLACERLGKIQNPCVLISGLGMGFTLRAMLDLLPRDAAVLVVELVPAVVEWNRGPLGPLAGNPLADKRVRVQTEDVAVTLRSSRGIFDAVLLDVDNDPSNDSPLYNRRGVAAAHSALKATGVFAVWSAREDAAFEKRLRQGRFAVEVKQARARLEKGGSRHAIFLGLKSTESADLHQRGRTAQKSSKMILNHRKKGT